MGSLLIRLFLKVSGIDEGVSGRIPRRDWLGRAPAGWVRSTARADFEAVAKPRGLTVAESAFFTRKEPIAGLGFAPAVAEQAFTMKEGEVSPAIRTPQGFAFISVTGREEARLPNLDEVRQRP